MRVMVLVKATDDSEKETLLRLCPKPCPSLGRPGVMVICGMTRGKGEARGDPAALCPVAAESGVWGIPADRGAC